MSSSARNAQKGLVPLYAIILVILALGAGIWALSSSSKIDKSDPEWLWKYCTTEVQKLPEAPMEYDQKLPVSSNGPSTYISNNWAVDLYENNKETCQIEYEYTDDIAFPSVGVEYAIDITNHNAFGEALSMMYHDSMPAGWELLSKVEDAAAGRPGYSTDALPLVYKRETRDTVEYLDVFDAVSFYVELTVYER
jgi:hypothetical protein